MAACDLSAHLAQNSSYWRSLHEWIPPLSLLLASPVVAAPQPPEATSPIMAPPQLSETSFGATC